MDKRLSSYSIISYFIWRGMIWCEIPLKLNKYISYELNKVYEERKPHICPKT